MRKKNICEMHRDDTVKIDVSVETRSILQIAWRTKTKPQAQDSDTLFRLDETSRMLDTPEVENRGKRIGKDSG